MNRTPTLLDRYPAKMVSHLAKKLISRYTTDCSKLMDPFCGSGAILAAGLEHKISVSGVDINPYAVLLSKVKLRGFDSIVARDICSELVDRARSSRRTLSVKWLAKDYWFTPATIHKYEQLRYIASRMKLTRTCEGRAVLLAYALSVRVCSRADQRSPKPFISKAAIKRRKGKHFDPMKKIPSILNMLAELYAGRKSNLGHVKCLNLTTVRNAQNAIGSFSHVITSPPYINAQDYFRNFKLELHLLEGLLPFDIESINTLFIGTERGELLKHIKSEDIKAHRSLLPQLSKIEGTHPRQAAIIHRYLYDMGKAFDAVKSCLAPGGTFVIVCGDNLVGGYTIETWQLLNCLLENRGFVLFDSFGDDINRRYVPPKRNGHKGLIKQEVISAFRLTGSKGN
jgi:hypothetical protein